jgi:hypothetical protein
VLLFTVAVSGDPEIQVPPDVFFGFTDAEGALILVPDIDSTATPDELLVVSPAGALPEAGFVEFREQEPGSSSRRTARNFDNLAGALYSLRDTVLTGDLTFVIAAAGFLEERILLPVTGLPADPPGGDFVTRVETERNLPVAEAWQLASIDTGIPVVLVRFEPGDSISLASIVADCDNGLIFADIEGTPMNDISVWRVDDGGVLYPGGFSVIAAFRTQSGLEIAVTWGAFEGELSSLLRQSGSEFVKVLSGYRYWAPM